MIDSFIFRIHNLKKYEHLVRVLHKEFRSGVAKKAVAIPKDYFLKEKIKALEGSDGLIKDYNETLKDIEPEQVQRFLKFYEYTDYKTGKKFLSSYRDFIKSHHYNVAYSISKDRDFIEFNFSIPKYLYGTNIFQFLVKLTDPNYYLYRSAGIKSEKYAERIFKNLFAFMDNFFKKNGIESVALIDLEVIRLDLVYNVVFNSKEDAKLYMGQILRHRKKHMKDTTSAHQQHHSDFYYPTEKFTYKIYHKGDEFKVHDKRKLKKRLPPSVLDQYQDFADKILRFEVEYWSKGIDHLAKEFFVKSDKRLLKHYRILQQVQRDGTFKDTDGIKKTYVQMTLLQKAAHKRMKKFFDACFDYHLDGKTLREIYDGEKGYVGLDFNTFRLMYNHFWKFVHEFDIKDISYVYSVVDAVESDASGSSKKLLLMQYLQRRGYPYSLKDISYTKFRMICNLLRSFTFKDLERDKVMGSSTLKRYKSIFAFIGAERISGSLKLNSRMDIQRSNDLSQQFLMQRQNDVNLFKSNSFR